MAATPIATVSRFFPTGTTKYIFCPSVANLSAPTRSEINAGTDLSPEIAEVEGWQVTSELIDVPDINSRFTSKIPGRTSADDSSITFYADPSGADARTLFPRDEEGVILRMDGGDVAGRKMDVFPIRVSSVPKEMGTGDGAGTLQVMFAITREPAENVTIPA
jgi:hypothetical protein